MPLFEGFVDADFDAFLERKWTSHAFNLERLQVKLKLAALGKCLTEILGAEIQGLEAGVTDERPSVFNGHQVADGWLYFYRDQKSRAVLGTILDRSRSIADNVNDPAPHHCHIVLGVRIDQRGLDVGLWLHRDAWLDWKNAVERCRGYGEEEHLGAILADLPASIAYCREGRLPEGPRTSPIDRQAVLQGFESATPWTVFGQSIARGDTVLSDGSLKECLRDCFQALLPLRAFIAWRPDNDHHNLKDALRVHKEKAERQFKEIQVGDRIRVQRGLAQGREGVIESIEKKGVLKVRMGLLVMSIKVDDVAQI